MSAAQMRAVERCPVCGVGGGDPFTVRRDGVTMRRCMLCGSIYIDRVPVDVGALYRDNYFALSEDDARANVESRIGYEASYESSYLDAEFYWAFRIADFVASQVQPEPRTCRCLDVGAATGRLLNVFAAAGYETYGIEFSAPARAISRGRGHAMTSAPAGETARHEGLFSVVTALEVIEHVEDLPAFFAGIHRVMADRGVFVGYFPSSDAVAFARSPGYHWLHSSFEHLVYPSEVGIRAVLAPHFGRDVHVATFHTCQGEDMIPYSVVVAIKGAPDAPGYANVAELFRQLAYLNDRASLDLGVPPGPGALGAAWDAVANTPGDGDAAQVPFVAGTICAKFGDFAVARHLRRDDRPLGGLDGMRLADLLVMAMHDGGIDWMRDRLPEIGERIPLTTVADECRAIVERFDAEHPGPGSHPGAAVGLASEAASLPGEGASDVRGRSDATEPAAAPDPSSAAPDAHAR